MKKSGSRSRKARRWDGVVRQPVVGVLHVLARGKHPRVKLTDGTVVCDGLAQLHLIHTANADYLLNRWDLRGCRLSGREDAAMAGIVSKEEAASNGVCIRASDWHRFRMDVGWVKRRRTSFAFAQRRSDAIQVEARKAELRRHKKIVVTPPARPPEPAKPARVTLLHGRRVAAAGAEKEAHAIFRNPLPIDAPVVLLLEDGRPKWFVASIYDDIRAESYRVMGSVELYQQR